MIGHVRGWLAPSPDDALAAVAFLAWLGGLLVGVAGFAGLLTAPPT